MIKVHKSSREKTQTVKSQEDLSLHAEHVGSSSAANCERVFCGIPDIFLDEVLRDEDSVG